VDLGLPCNAISDNQLGAETNESGAASRSSTCHTPPRDQGHRCAWKLGKDWFDVLVKSCMVADAEGAGERTGGNGSFVPSRAAAAAASAGRLSRAAAGRLSEESARSVAVWVEMCLEAARRRNQSAHKYDGSSTESGCRCGALPSGPEAEARGALATWVRLKGNMSVRLKHLQLVLLLSLPQARSSGAPDEAAPDEMEHLLTQAMQSLDGANRRDRSELKDRTAKLVTKLVGRASRGLLQQLRSPDKIARSGAGRSARARQRTGEQMASGLLMVDAMRTLQLIERLLVRCSQNRLPVHTEALQALGDMLSELASRQELACRRLSTAGNADLESSAKVDWMSLAAAAQAAVQAWQRPPPLWTFCQTNGSATGGAGQAVELGPGAECTTEESLAGQCKTLDQPSLSADSATGLVRLLRKGMMADEWQRRRTVRQAQALIAAVSPQCLSASLIAEMLLAMGGRHGGSGEQGAVQSLVARARALGVATGNVYRAAWLALGRTEKARALLEPCMTQDAVSLTFLDKQPALLKPGMARRRLRLQKGCKGSVVGRPVGKVSSLPHTSTQTPLPGLSYSSVAGAGAAQKGGVTSSGSVMRKERRQVALTSLAADENRVSKDNLARADESRRSHGRNQEYPSPTGGVKSRGEQEGSAGRGGAEARRKDFVRNVERERQRASGLSFDKITSPRSKQQDGPTEATARRESVSRKCFACHKAGHIASQCPKR
jgi:hypothetical protein